jgi:hypothetical protein
VRVAIGFLVLGTVILAIPIVLGLLPVIVLLAAAIPPLIIARSAFYFETSDRGLLVRGWFQRRFVEWSKIERIEEPTHRVGLARFRLHTDQDAVTMPKGNYTATVHLDASTWQHLRRLRNEDPFKLSPEALTLWQPISDKIPREMDWVNPDPPIFRRLAVCLVLISGIGLALWFTRYTHGTARFPFLSNIACATFFIIRMIVYPALRTPIRVRVREDGIEAELPRQTISLPWSEIVGADWYDVEALTLSGRRRRNIRIPFDRGTDSEALILAIIRRLREREDPLLIPIAFMADHQMSGMTVAGNS